MASEADQGERTEEATQQRREDFRKRGQVAQTRELSAVLIMFAAVLLIWMMSRFFFQQIMELFAHSVGEDMVAAVHGEGFFEALKFTTIKLSYIVVPILGFFWVIGFAASTIQVGFLYNEEALQWRWERLDPIAGFKRIL